jgi:hypothetical protein
MNDVLELSSGRGRPCAGPPKREVTASAPDSLGQAGYAALGSIRSLRAVASGREERLAMSEGAACKISKPTGSPVASILT